jgi:EAL domain-containing protein (putative c-di-GMP-specific phosphodiesterase class I)
MLTGNIERNIDIMHQIKATGAKLSIDDFGTGYSSLSYLKRFPIDELKIDRSFIVDIKFSREDKAIVEAIVAMARSLQLSVVAEGVENMEQLIALRNTGCNIAQGYYFSKPVSAAAFEQFCERTHVTKAEALATAG